ncbi:MAG: NUDIX hydrolase [Caldilineaceae bacterium]|nr:NUDIX hydrolase [Caldilineaceae bacterium]
MSDLSEQPALSNDPHPWAIHATTTAFQNRWITVALDQVQLPTGTQYEYTRVNVNGVGVAVVGFNRAGEILLEREYRHGVEQVVWQLPGGLANAAEDLVTAGLRELLEETGHAPAQVSAEAVRYLGMVWDNPGIGAMQSHVVAAWDLVETAHPRRDPAEFVTLHWRSVDWVKAAIRSGEIQDRVVLAALAYLIVNDFLG